MINKKWNIILLASSYFVAFAIQFVGFAFFRHETQTSLTIMLSTMFFAVPGNLFLLKLLPKNRLRGFKIAILIHTGGCALGCIVFLLRIAGLL